MDRVGQSGVLSYSFVLGNEVRRNFSDFFLRICYNAKKRKGRVIPPLPHEKMGDLLTSALKAHLYGFPLFKKFWFLWFAIECKSKNFQIIIKDIKAFIKAERGEDCER